MVTPGVNPERTNSLLLRLADVTVTDEPLAVRLPVRAELEPTATLPKLRLVGETAKVPAAVPVPESAILSGEFDAFETMERLPLTAPALAGVKVAVKVTLWPAGRLMGKPLNPVIEKAEPVTFAAEMVTVDPPVLLTVSDKFVLLPTCVLLNARLVGFALRAPAVRPVPESEMVRLESDPVSVMLTLPLAAPLALGLKVTVKDVLCPADNVTGRERPLMVNPVPVAEAAEMVRLVPPVLVRVSVCDFGVPI
jgi:hypothetical protein